jgi:hypothetical protein
MDPPAVPEHDRYNLLHAQQDPERVDGGVQPVLFGAQVSRLPVATRDRPGVVHQDVDAPETRDHLSDHGRYFFFGADVGVDRYRLIAQLGDDVLLGAAHVHDRHPRPLTYEDHGTSSADTTASARDDGDLAIEKSSHRVEPPGTRVRSKYLRTQPRRY